MCPSYSLRVGSVATVLGLVPRSVRIVLFVVLAALLAPLLPPAVASASQSEQVTFEAPRDLRYAETRERAFSDLESLGVRALRVVLYWRDVAPDASSRIRPHVDLTDPGVYDWSTYAPILDGARQRGWPVTLTVSGPVPTWATNGARDAYTRPNPAQFRAFMTAVSRRFSDEVARYSIWNEPNLPEFLRPQYDSRKQPVSPSIYRGLYIAGVQGLADADDKKPVLIGETAPNGKVPRVMTARARVAPLTFLRGVLCLNKNYKKTGHCAKLRIDGYAHHAYAQKAGPLDRPKDPNLVTIGVISRLTKALDMAARAGVVAKRLPVYITEFGVQSYPDKVVGVPPLQQNEYRAIAEKISYYNPRIVAFSQYLLTDDPPTGPPGPNCCGGFESGLRTAKGVNKPSFDGFRLPLVVRRSGKKVSIWGLARPATGATTVKIERRTGSGAWRSLGTVRTNGRGAFTLGGRDLRRATWRVSWTAPDSTVFHSPPVRAYTWR